MSTHLSTHWIHYLSRTESPSHAIQIIEQGYIPWSPEGGRHTMDDFGTLIQTLPQDYYDDCKDLDIAIMWGMDLQYRGH